jgi:hypothetical protein
MHSVTDKLCSGEALGRVLQFHEGESEALARSCCLAVKALAYHSEANKHRLREAKVCQFLILVLRGYRYSAQGIAVLEAAAVGQPIYSPIYPSISFLGSGRAPSTAWP